MLFHEFKYSLLAVNISYKNSNLLEVIQNWNQTLSSLSYTDFHYIYLQEKKRLIFLLMKWTHSQVNKYYDLVTSFYEYGWGESFHFAPRWTICFFKYYFCSIICSPEINMYLCNMLQMERRVSPREHQAAWALPCLTTWLETRTKGVLGFLS